MFVVQAWDGHVHDTFDHHINHAMATATCRQNFLAGVASLWAGYSLKRNSAYVSIRQHTSAYVSIRPHPGPRSKSLGGLFPETSHENAGGKVTKMQGFSDKSQKGIQQQVTKNAGIQQQVTKKGFNNKSLFP